jgi:hypothetical protein
MRKIILILLFLVFAAQGQQLQRIAVMGTEDDGDPPIAILEQLHLTDKLREIAGGILPKERYMIMTQQSIVDRLGSQEQAAKLCREAICLVDLGRKVNADYIAQARIGRFSGNLTIKIELYQVASGGLIASFTDNSKDVQGLLDVLEEKAPDLFKKMPGVVPEPPPPVAALPQPVSLAQVLRESSLSSGCVDDFANVLGRDGFSMGKFMKDLPPEVAKVKAQLKSPFGKPKDGDRTSVGLTVGCIKALPESPAEVQGLLKDIALKAGLDLALDVAANVADDYISTNIAKESGSGGITLKTAISAGLICGGLGTLLYGYTQDNKVSSSIEKRDGKAAVEARDNRNIGYGIGAALLVGGLGVVIFF